MHTLTVPAFALLAAVTLGGGCAQSCNSVSRALNITATSTVTGDGYDFGAQTGGGEVAIDSNLTFDPTYPFMFSLASQGSAGGPNGGPDGGADWSVSVTGDLSAIAAAWGNATLAELDGSELSVGEILGGSLSGSVQSGVDVIDLDASFVYTVTSYSAPLAGITTSDDNWTTPTFLTLDVYAHDDTSLLTVNGTLSFTAAKATEYESCDPCNGQGGLFGCE